MSEKRLTELSMIIGKPVYTLKEFIDDVINAEEKLVVPAKNINNYYVVEDCVYTKEELLEIEKHCETFNKYCDD